MVDLLEKLGVNWTLFIAQLVNFCLLFLILKRFLFKPVQSMLQKRTLDAEKLLSDQKKVALLLEESQKNAQAILQKAQKDAQELLTKAEELAQANTDSLIAETTVQLEQMEIRHKEKMVQQMDEARKALKKETVTLVLLMLSKILKKANHDQANYEKMLQEELRQLELK